MLETTPSDQLETSNPEEFRKHVENGRQVYYRNCVFCHGDNLGGNGMFAHALNPIPTNFADGQTLANLSETFLFWRISKGGPGMPEEGAPWDTAMPAWEKFLKEEEMWDVILFLYDFTGERPAVRALGGRARMTSSPAVACVAVAVLVAVVVGVPATDGIGARAGSRRRDRGAAGVGQEPVPQDTARSATARKGTAQVTPRRICSPGPATSRRASSRFARLPAERSRPIRISSTSSGSACPTPRCPPGPTLSDQEVSDLAYFLTTFSPDFSNPESVPQPLEFPSAPSATNESIELGKKLYAETGCLKCHGNLGRGDGPSAPTLTDDLGQPIRAANLTQSWTFRGGSSREDIFRTMTTGLNGTPMPSFADSLTTEQRWAITDFIVSLSGSNGPGYTNLVVAKPVQDPIDLAKGAASFESAPVARFPILGQITEPGRSFHPPATSVTVQAIYDAESIALLVRWHDMGADKDGEERAVASRAAGGGGVGARRCQASRR